MGTKIKVLLLHLAIICSSAIFSQNFPSDNQSKEIDSLRTELRNARYDTTKIRLRFDIGHKTWLKRLGYWDSLVNDAARLNVKLFEGRAYNKLSFIYSAHGDFDKGIECAEKSLLLAKQSGKKREMLSPLNNLAVTHLVVNDLANATKYCYENLKIATELNDKMKIILAHRTLASIYAAISDTEMSLKEDRLCLKLFKELNYTEGIASSLCRLGAAYEGLKNKEKAIWYYMESRKYIKGFENSPTGTNSYNGVGKAYSMQKMYDSAEYYHTLAADITRKNGDNGGLMNSLLLLAELSFERKDINKAEKLALEAFELAKTTSAIQQERQIKFLLKEIYLQKKDYVNAIKYYDMYAVVIDSMSNGKNRKDLLIKHYDYEFEKKANENKLLAQKNQIQELELKQNNYFLAGMAVLLTLAVLIGYLFIRQNRLRTEQQSTRLEQKLLLSQMNPHFIFNSLQAIQNFILKHDEKTAVKYLSSFAAVTRNVLENSRMEVIPLKKEIALLENYLQLQKLRFKDRFNYEIYVDDLIDVESTFIPPMLSQPFIENAIEHGFHNIENDGMIKISYTVKNNNLLMEICDNGIGIKENPQNKDHRSLALEITKERIILMNKKATKKVIFSIGEAFPLMERKGVKVIFSLPLNWQI